MRENVHQWGSSDWYEYIYYSLRLKKWLQPLYHSSRKLPRHWSGYGVYLLPLTRALSNILALSTV